MIRKCLWLVIVALSTSSAVSGQNLNVEIKKQQIDSLLAAGENMFYASQDILFKYLSNVDSPAELIKMNDLIILLRAVDNNFYEVEWDNKVGYIFQYDIEPYDLTAEDHYLDTNPINDLSQTVRYGPSIINEETDKDVSISFSEVIDNSQDEIDSIENVTKPENTLPVNTSEELMDEKVEKIQSSCWIQFFASRYSNKSFSILNDLGSISATTDFRDNLTRYRLSVDGDDQKCDQVIIELAQRGFPGAFKVYE